MRPIVATLLLLAMASVAQAQSPAPTPPPSADLVLRFRPLAWRAPVAALPITAGMRLEPDTGEAIDSATGPSLARRAHPLAALPVQSRADGSKFAVVAGKLRSFTVVSIGADGKLAQDCVHSEQEAIARVKASTQSGGN